MKAVTRLQFALIATGLISTTLCAGPEPIPASSKEVAPIAPLGCNWSGFYLGINVGGQFGHSEDKDLDDYNFPDKPWGYSESSFVAGEQIGYNWQFDWFLVGSEIDAGYMDLNGRGLEPGVPHDTSGESDSDFYMTFRGRFGIAMNCWLIYATGGLIGVNYHTSVEDTSLSLAGPDSIHATEEELNWGYTVGGGVERMFEIWNRRWSFKVEYLYFTLDGQTFSALSANGFGPYRWRAETDGHIVRAGLNFHF